ncbi:MAG: exo-alpha-sialidase, partial [Candidatus Hydrogenedentes bacterium]|nr:exo-alpha-sialidase [Candidatus Hydrogenedentota bacterium]
MNYHTARFVFLLICLGSTSAGFAVPAIIDTVVVFDHGTEGYHTFRIPALARTLDNTLLAFCEGRKNGMTDTGDIDLVLRRSQDGGETWSPLILVVDDAANTCGNPVPVVLHSGEILLVLTKNNGDATENEINRGTAAPRSVWLTRSKDDGVTWST